MKFWDNYIAYLKDNPEGYWFKRKLYGWGWTPARWQGWMVMLVYIAFVFGTMALMSKNAIDDQTAMGILLPFLGATALFLAVVWKTGEPPKWQWGSKEHETK